MAKDYLCNKTRQKTNRISMERSRITKRFAKHSEPNIQTKTFLLPYFGRLRMKISNSTSRTIDKHGSLEKFLVTVKRSKLTTKAKKLRKVLYEKIANKE